LNNEWIKVAIKFDEENPISPQESEQPPVIPSWTDFDNITDLLDEDIKIFGSYTILIHSITMFFIITLLSLLMTICIMNFFDYIPERFKTLPIIVESPQPPVDAESMASPEG
jgi:hypothetical protein